MCRGWEHSTIKLYRIGHRAKKTGPGRVEVLRLRKPVKNGWMKMMLGMQEKNRLRRTP